MGTGTGGGRVGRPRIQDTADDLVASVLATAGSRVGTPEFSTRRVAELTGLSQTVVSRSFRRLRRRGAGSAGPAGPAGSAASAERDVPLELAALQVAFPRIRVVFRPAEAPAAAPRRTAADRRATALLAALRVAGVGQWAGGSEGVGEVGDAGEAGGVGGAGQGRASAGRLVHEWSPGGDWEAFLEGLAAALDCAAPSLEALPGDLLALLAARVGRGLHGVDWRRGTSRRSGDGAAAQTEQDSDSDEPNDEPGEMLGVPEYPAPGPRPARDRSAGRWLPHGELSVTEQIAIALRREIMNAGYRPGDRITAGPLAATLGLSAATVRTAMRRLADDGLLDSGVGGFSVPAVTGADVVDLYAARLHVGMVLLRGVAARPRHRMLPARLALGAVEAAARQGSGADVERADLQFQQELADASGLEQSARSFHALTLRVRMFISVLQLDYTPAAERIVADDRRLLAAVLEGRAEDAVRIWRGKLDNAVRHMSALAPEAFDAELWARLSR